MTDDMALRPVREDDFGFIETITQDPELCGEFAWFGWYDPRKITRGWDEHRLLGEERTLLMVVAGDRRLGFVSYWKRATARGSYCFNMGIGMHPDARGEGYGTEAHRLLVRYLFAHTTVHRVEADTEVENLAEQRALEKAGFTREGVTRASAFRDGAWRDGVTYSVLRTDPAVG